MINFESRHKSHSNSFIRTSNDVMSNPFCDIPNDVCIDIIERIDDVPSLLNFRACCHETAYFIVPFVPHSSLSVYRHCRKNEVRRGREYVSLDPNGDTSKSKALIWMDRMLARNRRGTEMIYTTDALNVAARNGHLKVVQILHGNCPEICTTSAVFCAAENGHLQVLEWLSRFCRTCNAWTRPAMNKAAKKGHLEVVKWLYHNASDVCVTHAIEFADEHGHKDVTEWLHVASSRTRMCTTGCSAKMVHLVRDKEGTGDGEEQEVGRWRAFRLRQRYHDAWIDDIDDLMLPFRLDRMIRSLGGRGGTYLSNDDVNEIACIISGTMSSINTEVNDLPSWRADAFRRSRKEERAAELMESVAYLRMCLDQSDGYDWTQYMEQASLVRKLERVMLHFLPCEDKEMIYPGK